MQDTEQRRFKRYCPLDGAIATLKPFEEFGLIKDISKGGLSFEYLAFSAESDAVPEIGKKRQIDVFILGEDFSPMTFPCKVVRVENQLLGLYTHSVVPKKRCGIEFVEFGQKMTNALNSFLAQCRDPTKPLFEKNMEIK